MEEMITFMSRILFLLYTVLQTDVKESGIVTVLSWEKMNNDTKQNIDHRSCADIYTHSATLRQGSGNGDHPVGRQRRIRL